MRNAARHEAPGISELDSDQQDSAQVAALAASQVHPESALPSRADYHVTGAPARQASAQLPPPPRIAPAGMAKVEITMRTASGLRAEFTGIIDKSVAGAAFSMIVEAAENQATADRAAQEAGK